ncbi:metalloregulator ArsR/SmtB family transcription factor [Halioxenophilus sp. WMMB6]|uniref:metalloregulator ArsR/SmtB family transcription factor n=1 Tax=Halioxenophilus sp. WMMB6 TaxID=3073815 RepID=UPI00295F4E50|nr:metalloregulator ArsR/SmtB family transcription factor [Halioxenophilus sp. WMMB6]
MDAVQLFKCLSDTTRLKATLLVYQEGELCVCELMTALAESQPKISRHLAPLRAAGILTDCRKGQWVYYSINPNLPHWAIKILDQALKSEKVPLLSCSQNLKVMNNRPSCN